MTLWNVSTQSTTWLDRLVALLPLLAGFGVPIVLLLVVYFELRKRTVCTE